MLGPPLLVDAGASSGTKTSTLWMLPPREAMQSEIRDGELRTEARGVSQGEGGLRAEEDGRRRRGTYGRRRSRGGGAVGAAAQWVGQWVGEM